MKKLIKVSAILLAAGAGVRLRAKQPKAFVALGGEPLFLRSLRVLQGHSQIQEVVLVVPRAYLAQTRRLAPAAQVVVGGATRAASLAAGLKKIDEILRSTQNDSFVLVHNAANPFLTSREITATIQAAEKCGAAAVAHSATATVKQVAGGRVVATLDRSQLQLTETPQVVRRDLLTQGLKIAKQRKLAVTDDIQLAELAGIRPRLVPVSEQNRKITTAADLKDTEYRTQNPEFRTGLGQDSHPFASYKKPLVLCGVRISATGGLAGNSDGDVALHALCNALSSAVGGGSLSTWSDALCRRGIKDSRRYLAEIVAKLARDNWQIVNVSLSLEAARPKVESISPKFRRNLAGLLDIAPECIGITATTGERLTAWGRGEGIQCFALVLLKKCE